MEQPRPPLLALCETLGSTRDTNFRLVKLSSNIFHCIKTTKDYLSLKPLNLSFALFGSKLSCVALVWDFSRLKMLARLASFPQKVLAMFVCRPRWKQFMIQGKADLSGNRLLGTTCKWIGLHWYSQSLSLRGTQAQARGEEAVLHLSDELSSFFGAKPNQAAGCRRGNIAQGRLELLSWWGNIQKALNRTNFQIFIEIDYWRLPTAFH